MIVPGRTWRIICRIRTIIIAVTTANVSTLVVIGGRRTCCTNIDYWTIWTCLCMLLRLLLLWLTCIVIDVLLWTWWVLRISVAVYRRRSGCCVLLSCWRGIWIWLTCTIVRSLTTSWSYSLWIWRRTWIWCGIIFRRPTTSIVWSGITCRWCRRRYNCIIYLRGWVWFIERRCVGWL